MVVHPEKLSLQRTPPNTVSKVTKGTHSSGGRGWSGEDTVVLKNTLLCNKLLRVQKEDPSHWTKQSWRAVIKREESKRERETELTGVLRRGVFYPGAICPRRSGKQLRDGARDKNEHVPFLPVRHVLARALKHRGTWAGNRVLNHQQGCKLMLY